MRRRRPKPGSVLAIPLKRRRLAFAMVLEAPLVAFYDFSCARSDQPELAEIIRKPVAFAIWVMKYALTDDAWPLVGVVPALALEPWFFKKDPLNGQVTILKTGTKEVVLYADSSKAWSARPSGIPSMLSIGSMIILQGGQTSGSS